MHEFPQGLPFLQIFDFAMPLVLSVATPFSDLLDRRAVPLEMWQTSSFEMQAFPQGLPFVQCFAA